MVEQASARSGYSVYISGLAADTLSPNPTADYQCPRMDWYLLLMFCFSAKVFQAIWALLNCAMCAGAALDKKSSGAHGTCVAHWVRR